MEVQEPPALEVTYKELIAAVEKGCRILSVPAVPTSNIAEFDDITIHQQTVKNRLEALSDVNEIGGMQVGRGYIWWVPEGETKGGTVDDTTLSGGFIDWKRIDGSDIPPDILTSAIQELDYEEVTESVNFIQTIKKKLAGISSSDKQMQPLKERFWRFYLAPVSSS